MSSKTPQAKKERKHRILSPGSGAGEQLAMSKVNKQSGPTSDHPAKGKPRGDYEVGYCRPPAEHRFKRGNNANPKGRRKGSNNRKVVIENILLEQISVREGGELKQMSKLEALLKKTVSDALGGDKKSATTVFAIAQKEGLLTPEQVEEAVEGLAEDDAAIIEAYKQRVLASQSPQPGKHQAHSVAEDPDAEV